MSDYIGKTRVIDTAAGAWVSRVMVTGSAAYSDAFSRWVAGERLTPAEIIVLARGVSGDGMAVPAAADPTMALPKDTTSG